MSKSNSADSDIPQISLNDLIGVDERVVDMWKKYEDIAMHFNDLMMRWRLQAMGGLATLVTLAGFVVGPEKDLEIRYRAMMILSGMLAFAWTGVAIIDLFYYRRLLKGAVESILAIEEQAPSIHFSTQIEKRAKVGGKRAPVAFYVFGLLPLIGIFTYAIIMWCNLPSEKSPLVSPPAGVSKPVP